MGSNSTKEQDNQGPTVFRAGKQKEGRRKGSGGKNQEQGVTVTREETRTTSNACKPQELADEVKQKVEATVTTKEKETTSSIESPKRKANVPETAPCTKSPRNEPGKTLFRWTHGGKNVAVTGSFNNWSEQVPMIREGSNFTYSTVLKPGCYTYKFVVDGHWKNASDQPTSTDQSGNVNNVVTVK